jgi:hypothetical protein
MLNRPGSRAPVRVSRQLVLGKRSGFGGRYCRFSPPSCPPARRRHGNPGRSLEPGRGRGGVPQDQSNIKGRVADRRPGSRAQTSEARVREKTPTRRRCPARPQAGDRHDRCRTVSRPIAPGPRAPPPNALEAGEASGEVGERGEVANPIASRPRASSAQEAFDLGFRPSQHLFHRLALQMAHGHLGHDALHVDLHGNLGRGG